MCFKCPVCGSRLEQRDRTLKCQNNHCFDMAKQGYVNLLQSQKSSKKRHGDDSLMVKARQDFLEKGYYNKLCEAVVDAVVKNTPQNNAVVADLGCGECWYTQRVYNSLDNPTVFGIDISKQALIAGSKRCKDLKLAVASTADIPLPDESCDAAVCVFAPYSETEALRVLKRGGVFIKAFPLEEHLIELKSVIYDKPYKNEVIVKYDPSFEQLSLESIKYEIKLESNADIMNLFMMTPYYYKTGQSDQHKLERLCELKTKAEFGVIVLKKL